MPEEFKIELSQFISWMKRTVVSQKAESGEILDEGKKLMSNEVVKGRNVMVKLLLLIYGRLDGRALRVRKPISSSARCQASYSSLLKVHENSIANYLSIIYSALVVQVVQ